jgi:hypothetical protein
MNKDIADQWVAALRSGEYVQGRNRLCNIHTDGVRSYCCLGVLVDLAVKAGVIADGILDVDRAVGVDDPSVKACYAYGIRRDAAFLPNPVVVWAGLGSSGGYRGSAGIALYQLNDEDRADFGQIADVIEAEWADL